MTDDDIRTVLIAHHTPDVYGSDLQLLESVTALTERGMRVVVSVPGDGPLLPLLRERGAEIVDLEVAALRKSALTPLGLVRLAVGWARAIGPAVRAIRRNRADAVYVNTVTIPLWIVAARIARVPVVCHVHEAHDEGPRVVRAGLAAPLLLADAVVVNSAASLASLRNALRPVTRRASIVYNGIGGPETSDQPGIGAYAADGGPKRLLVVGRLSPRKGTDIAVEALAVLVARGYDVRLDIAGSVFEGYEWFEQQLRDRAGQSDLTGLVTFHGYVRPTWPLLAEADVVIVPSRTEPFGNTAVEAQLARRPVVASRVQGLREIVRHGETGLLVTPEDPAALAEAVASVLDQPTLARKLADAGLEGARSRFSPDAYRQRVAEVLGSIIASS